MKYELKRIAVWPVIRITFMLSLVLGFITGIFYAIFITMFAFLPMQMGGTFGSEPDLPMAVGGILLVIMPIFMAGFMAVINTIMAIITTLVYNLAARLTGGLEWELAPLDKRVIQPASTTPPPPADQPGAGDYSA
ncbi:MAG: DUF3566 domain-containing protein [candidate division Zixibacteria bacterium]|nr:DUF3566 domain-containing protein [candidate division Zixibacteria bacterium]